MTHLNYVFEIDAKIKYFVNSMTRQHAAIPSFLHIFFTNAYGCAWLFIFQIVILQIMTKVVKIFQTLRISEMEIYFTIRNCGMTFRINTVMKIKN